ncbi:uncharacterized protein LOC121732321 isoform X2 [Aricia agestis]|nr:uncharacterized protein LOC121732321 isoform X2 [Aricia agestis]XP_041978104.1 uncharacterized protein LOC121732321 isoform X2 [Aricia agestis]
MWYPWIALLLCALAAGAAGQDVAEPQREREPPREREGVATRPPPRTLDRKADELAWHSWLQGPENDGQNATHRRITTKSLFITPLVCPKGQRLDRNGCVTVLNVNKEEHERILLDQLNAYFTADPNNGGDMYDYGEEEQGPLQLTIPIGQESQAELSAQAQNQQPTFVQFDKKGDGLQTDGSIEAELELLKLQQAVAKLNRTGPLPSNSLSHGALNNLLTYSDKPKRDSPLINETETNVTDKGQEEKIFGHVNIDPLAYGVQNQNQEVTLHENKNNKTETPVAEKLVANNMTNTESQNNNTRETVPNTTMQSLKAAPEQTKLRPEIEYSDIDEAIKLISRFADVSTDDNFAKDDRKPDLPLDDSVLGTRTKLQYRRNKPKIVMSEKEAPIESLELRKTEVNLNSGDILKYPWPNASPPPDYPFRRLQDYWPGRNQVGGVYNMHENPRRHHHSYPHYFHPRPYPYTALSEQRASYPRLRRFPHKLSERMDRPARAHGNDQDLYSLLGLRHWFGSEGASKR